MSSIVTAPVNIAGINGVVVQLEYTSSNVFTSYQNDINTIQSILTQKDQNGNIIPVSADDAKKLADALTNLRNLLVKGQTDPATGVVSYMTAAMATQLDIVFRSLQTIGVDTKASSISFASTGQADLWQSVVNLSSMLQGVFAFADSPTSNQSLQSLIELQYVQTSNNLLSDQLSSLEGAVKSTQSALNTLNTLQELHNQIATQQGLGGGSFSAYINQTIGTWNPTTMDANQFQEAYAAAASAFFGTITPMANIATYSIPGWMTDLYTIAQTGKVDSNGNTVIPPINPISSITTPDPRFPDSDFNLIFLTPPGGFTPTPSFLSHFAGRGFKTYPTISTYIDSVTGRSMTMITGENHNADNSGPFFLSDDWLTFFNPFPNSGVTITNEIQSGYASITVNKTPQGGGTLTVRSPEFTASPTTGTVLKLLKTYAGQVSIFSTGGISQLISLRGMLSNQIIPALSAITPTLPGGAQDPTTLLAQVRTVLSDIKTSFVTKTGAQVSTNTSLLSAASGFSRWMVDRYNSIRTGSSNMAGQYQQDIVSAVTAAQSLNATQSQNVQNFLYVFEEYYKSANGILQSISQFIEQMAQGIKS